MPERYGLYMFPLGTKCAHGIEMTKPCEQCAKENGPTREEFDKELEAESKQENELGL